jgi:hypothetical protein
LYAPHTTLSYYASYLILINTSVHKHSTECTAHSIYWPYVWMWVSGLCACASEYYYLVADWLKLEKYKSGILKNISVRRTLRKFNVYVHIGYTAHSYSQLIDGKIRLIETSLVCNSFVATSNNSNGSLSSNYISLSVGIWNSLLACLAFRLLVGI